MKYKLIISDFDGTLADSGGRASQTDLIPAPVLDAIDKFRQAGGKFVVCSGRPTDTAHSVLNKAGLKPDALITYQGAIAFIGSEMVVNGGVKTDLASKIAKDIKDKFNRDCGTYISDAYYYEGDNPYTVGYANFCISHGMTVKKVEDLSSFITENGGVSQKLIVSKAPTEELADVQNYVMQNYGDKVVANSGAPTILEIVSVDYTKYTTSKFIAEKFGLKEEETVTIGDSSNDLTLIKFGVGCAVGDGSKELIANADYVAPPIGEMPVKNIIDKILNNEDLV